MNREDIKARREKTFQAFLKATKVEDMMRLFESYEKLGEVLAKSFHSVPDTHTTVPANPAKTPAVGMARNEQYLSAPTRPLQRSFSEVQADLQKPFPRYPNEGPIMVRGRLTGFPLTEAFLNFHINPTPENYSEYVARLLRCPWRTGDMFSYYERDCL